MRKINNDNDREKEKSFRQNTKINKCQNRPDIEGENKIKDNHENNLNNNNEENKKDTNEKKG